MSSSKTLSVGRSRECDVVLPPAEDDTLSRLHFYMVVTGPKSVTLTDKSSWGTYLIRNPGKIKLTKGAPKRLSIDDVVELGANGYRVRVSDLVDEAKQSQPVDSMRQYDNGAAGREPPTRDPSSNKMSRWVRGHGGIWERIV